MRADQLRRLSDVIYWNTASIRELIDFALREKVAE